MTSFELPLREVGLIVSVAIFCVVTAGVVLAQRMNGNATPALRYGLSALWLMALLRLYSASSFIWGSAASDAGVFPILRIAVLVVLTLTLILVLTLVWYYARRWRRLQDPR